MYNLFLSFFFNFHVDPKKHEHDYNKLLLEKEMRSDYNRQMDEETNLKTIEPLMMAMLHVWKLMFTYNILFVLIIRDANAPSFEAHSICWSNPRIQRYFRCRAKIPISLGYSHGMRWNVAYINTIHLYIIFGISIYRIGSNIITIWSFIIKCVDASRLCCCSYCCQSLVSWAFGREHYM